MRRLFVTLALCIALAGVLCIPASAETAATQVNMQCTVTSDGDCRVSMNLRLRLEDAYDQMAFPIPANARSVTLNGNNASTSPTSSATLVDLSKITRDYTGDISVDIGYTIPEAVKVTLPEQTSSSSETKLKPFLQLAIPLLCSFDYPVEFLSFTITMPSENMTDTPTFTSIYRQISIMSDLNVEVRGSQIIGTSLVKLNDREGITMTMRVPEEMFPSVSTYVRQGNPELVPIVGFALAALLYWVLFLRCLPILPIRATTPPEGITAGELGCRLTLSGGDLTMMVFSWAQLGYLLIHMDGNGRVMLHKRMDMGNERSQFENKIFRALFGSRRVVDGTGIAYAVLSQRVATMIPNERNMYKGSSGNPKIFRGLACISQAFCGICVAMNMSTVPVLEWMMALILAIFGLVSAWLIQAMAYRTHLRGKMPFLVGILCILVWLGLGFLCQQIWIPLGCCAGQVLMGYMAAYGGRRSDLGRNDAGMVLGLRRYLKRLPRTEINRLLSLDPDYFFNMAPHAMALGVLNPYTQVFGRRDLECPYLITPVHGKRTAEDWGQLMLDAADMMDTRARRMKVEKLFAVDVPLPRPARKRGARPRKKKSE